MLIGGVKTPRGSGLSLWRSPRPGRLLINVDASVEGGQCAWVMVVRNNLGNLIYLAFWWGENQFPQLAECKDLV